MPTDPPKFLGGMPTDPPFENPGSTPGLVPIGHEYHTELCQVIFLAECMYVCMIVCLLVVEGKYFRKYVVIIKL